MVDRENKTAPGQFFAALDVPAPARPVKVGRRHRLVAELIDEAHLLINTAKSIRAFDAKGNVWDVLAQLDDVMTATCRRTAELVTEIEGALAVERAHHQPDPSAADLDEDRDEDLSRDAGWALRHLLLRTDQQVAEVARRVADSAANPAFVRPAAPAPEPSQYQRSLQDRINERVIMGFDGAGDASNLSTVRVRGNGFLYVASPGEREATFDDLITSAFRAHTAQLGAAAGESEDVAVKSAPGQDVPVQVNVYSVSPSPADMPRQTSLRGRVQGRVR